MSGSTCRIHTPIEITEEEWTPLTGWYVVSRFWHCERCGADTDAPAPNTLAAIRAAAPALSRGEGPTRGADKPRTGSSPITNTRDTL